MKNVGINFVSACSGGLRFRIGTEEGEQIVRRADTIEDGVYWIQMYGVDETGIAASSSMDFADEYGFEHYNGARDMMDEIFVEAHNANN